MSPDYTTSSGEKPRVNAVHRPGVTVRCETCTMSSPASEFAPYTTPAGMVTRWGMCVRCVDKAADYAARRVNRRRRRNHWQDEAETAGGAR